MTWLRHPWETSSDWLATWEEEEMPVRHEPQRPQAESKLIYGEPLLELEGVRVFLHKSEDDGELVVQIETPEGSDIHERMRVYMNDGEAFGWK